MTGIVLLPLIPLRKTAAETSEMTSQLLFGEKVDILESTEHWFFIQNQSDKYQGWIDQKMLHLITEQEEYDLREASAYKVKSTIASCIKTSSNQQMFVSAGSLWHQNDLKGFRIANEIFQINSSDLISKIDNTQAQILKVAYQFLNVPYLWGGKSILGIDCSGFTQVVFSLAGIQLPRNAYEQAHEGQELNSLSKAKACNLAFFENADGKIIHVGILLNSQQIIHASGWVKIENIDSKGIISTQTGQYTHKLRLIKKII
jgi:cell wall-associated NlpC family hydrolase